MIAAISPAVSAHSVTPSDSTAITITKGLYVGSGGNVAVTFLGGETATFVGVPTGTILPVQVVKVLSSGTAASSILALY